MLEIIVIILNIITGIVFFYLGRLSKYEQDPIIEAVKSRISDGPKAGNLSFKQPDEIKYDKSKEKQVEDQWDKLKL